MLSLNDVHRAFLNAAIPRILEEVTAFQSFKHITFTDLESYSFEDALELKRYRKNFLLYGFVELTGTLFFISNNILDGGDELMDRYIDFCKMYGKLYGVT